MSCQFPYTLNSNGECITFAKYLGASYLAYHIIFTTLACGAILCATYHNYLIHRFTSRKEKHQKKAFLGVVWLMSICLFIQGIDPQGYNGILPPVLEVLAANFCTLMGLFLIFTLIFGLVRIHQRVNLKLYNGIFVCVIIFSVLITVLFSILQVTKNRNLYRGIKLILYSAVTTISAFALNRLLNNSMNIMTNFHSELILTVKFRLKYYLGIFNCFVIFLSICQAISGIASLLKHSKEITPNITMEQIIYPLAQFMGIMIGVTYMYRVKENDIYQKFRISLTSPTVTINEAQITRNPGNIPTVYFGRAERQPHI